MDRKSGKLKLGFIENQKSRKQTFKRRNECLTKKMKELSTLCDVNACMVLYDAPTAPATVWPPNDPALVRELIHLFWAKNLKNDGDEEEKAQFGACLRKKAELVKAQIHWLKSQRQREIMDDQYHHQQQQDQFGPVFDLDNSPLYLEDSSTELPRGPLTMDDSTDDDDDDDELKQRELIMGYNSSSSNYGQQQQQQQYQLFGPSSSMYQEEETMMSRGPLVIDDTELKQRESMGYSSPSSNFGNKYQYQQQQYELFGPVVDLDGSSSMCQEDSSTAMMMNPDQMMRDDTCCGMGFDEQTSRETAAVDDFYDGGLITQLYTPPRPPMMMWQSTDDHLMITQFADKGTADYLQCIDFDDLWV